VIEPVHKSAISSVIYLYLPLPLPFGPSVRRSYTKRSYLQHSSYPLAGLGGGAKEKMGEEGKGRGGTKGPPTLQCPVARTLL